MKKKNRLLALAVAVLVSGCVVIPIDDHEKVAGWPQLKVVEHHVSQFELREQCTRFAPPLTTAVACTLFDFDRREAHIYVSKDFPQASILAHERLHAAGYDHVGSRAMTRMWEDWKVRREQAFLIR